MSYLWEHIFENELMIDPKSINVLISDSPLNTKENKVEIASVLFEKFKVNSLSIMNSAVLSLFSTGRTSGIVVESG
jgi:actin